jgi:hypothetical protein
MISRYFAGLSAVIALLAGCGGSQLPTGAQGAMQQSRAPTSHVAKNEDLIYMSDCCGKVLVYSYSGRQVGSLTGLQGATSDRLCADKSGNVWVTDAGILLEYAHAGTAPIAKMYLSESQYANGCAVDPSTGNLAVAEGSGHLLVFLHAQGKPKVYTDPDLATDWYCGYDDHGNLFVEGSPSDSRSGRLAELPSGRSKMVTVSLSRTLGRGGEVQWDGQHVAIGDNYDHVVLRVDVSGKRGHIVSITSLTEGHPRIAVQSWIQGSQIILPFYHRGWWIGFYKFPAGGGPTHTFQPGYPGEAVTVSVASSR